MADSENRAPAVACSLSSVERQARRQRFADLNREFLIDSQRSDTNLRLTYSLGAAAVLRELVQLEQECCPFLGFQLEIGDKSAQLSVAVPESARDSVDVLLEPFLPRQDC